MDKQLSQYNPELIVLHRMMERLKLMISNGKKLSDAEAAALAQFAVTEGLDPFSGECYLLKNENKNEISGRMVGVRGLRRKARERLGDSESYFVEFKAVAPPTADILYAFDCI